jgi:hypothetical protein
LVDTFLGFAHYSFEKRQAATCHFSKEFCKNPGNISANRKKGIKIHKNSACTPCLQKSFVNLKAFGAKRLKTYKFNIILKGEFTKY